jgi:hypothetical protein
VVCTLSCCISTFVFLALAILFFDTFFYVQRYNNVLCLHQYHRFMMMEMLLLTQFTEAMSLFLRQLSKVLSDASSIFFFKLWQAPMSKTFYLTCIYLNYIQGSKSSTQIIIYSQSQLFTGFPKQEFNREDCEGLEKATRGGEWEPIKIPRVNLAYIPKSTRHPSLLTRPRPQSYKKAIGPRNQVRNCSRNMN